jgi:hypothetical protein
LLLPLLLVPLLLLNTTGYVAVPACRLSNKKTQFFPAMQI